MEMLRNFSDEVLAFMEKGGKIKTAAASKGGHSIAKVDPEFREIFGEVLFCENRPIKGSFNGRDHVRQGSQKKMWTRGVRQAMASTIQHREHKQMLREGKVGVGAGIIEVPTLKTGTEG